VAMIPKDLPPRSTTFGDFARWRDDGLFGRINHHLVMVDRDRVGRSASPTAAVLDSQSVKTTQSGGPRGYDAGKKIKGRKRQALVNTIAARNGASHVSSPSVPSRSRSIAAPEPSSGRQRITPLQSVQVVLLRRSWRRTRT
jgi:transposase